LQFGNRSSSNQHQGHTLLSTKLKNQADFTPQTAELGLITGVCTVLVGAMLLSFIRIDLVSTQLAMGRHAADTCARKPLDNIVAVVRRAQKYGASQAFIYSAAASDISIYLDSNGATARFWLDTSAQPYTLKYTTAAGTQVIATALTGLTFTYYLATGNTPSQGSCWRTTTNPYVPTSAELPNIVAVSVAITYPVDGSSQTYTCTVRLRNASRAVSGK
jgi:hypothetical protein